MMINSHSSPLLSQQQLRASRIAALPDSVRIKSGLCHCRLRCIHSRAKTLHRQKMILLLSNSSEKQHRPRARSGQWRCQKHFLCGEEAQSFELRASKTPEAENEKAVHRLQSRDVFKMSSQSHRTHSSETGWFSVTPPWNPTVPLLHCPLKTSPS